MIAPLEWIGVYGIAVPHRHDLFAVIAALVIAGVAIACGWAVGRWPAPALARGWTRRFGEHSGAWSGRLPALLGNGTTAAITIAALAGARWAGMSAFLLGTVAGFTGALALIAALRGVLVPRWAAYVMGVITFVAVQGRAMGGLHAILHLLEQIGIGIGRHRLSLLSVLTAAVMLILLYAAMRVIERLLFHWVERADGLDPTQKLLFQKISGIAVVIVAIFIGGDIIGIDLTSLTVFSGAVGLAVGFGLQKTVGNLIAGIILLMDRSIKPGDVIVVGDSFGSVKKIGVRAVSVITREGKEHLIPNENLMTQEVENWSYSDRNVRVRIPVGISYSSDLRLAQELMLRAARESHRVLNTPPPNVWLTAFGDSSVDHEILVWISDPESGLGNVKSDVLNRLWTLFREHGVEIPFPQRDIWVRNAPAPETPPATEN